MPPANLRERVPAYPRDVPGAVGANPVGRERDTVFDAVIFDLDGLLVDTEMPYYRAWCALYRRYGCELPLDIWLQCLGTRDIVDFWDLLEEMSGRTLDRKTLREPVKRRFLADLKANLRPLPGVRDLLRQLQARGIPAGLASASPEEWVSSMLEAARLRPYFSALVTLTDVERCKPHPDAYLKCAEKLGVPPERCLALEDSCYGLEAAKRAGMTCFVVPSEITRLQDLSRADRTLGSLEELNLDELVAEAA